MSPAAQGPRSKNPLPKKPRSMKPFALFASIALSAVGASALTAYYLSRAEPAPAARTETVQPAAGLERELAERLARLEQRLTELAARPTLAPSEARLPLEQLEETVRRVLAQNQAEFASLPPGEFPTAASAATETGLPRDTEDLLTWLEDLSEGELAIQLRWEKVRASGRIDEVVAAYQERATARPDDPMAQVDLGNAYLQKLFQIGDGPVKGMVAMQADSAFDRALAVDPQHWEARYTKAVSLSHWPPVLGKQAEAIGHFETLVLQQRTMAPQPHHVQTYILLGNLYQQSGKAEQAKATWQEGLGVFPGHAALIEALSRL